LAAEISEKLGVQPELVKGTTGVFDIVADGALIFSKHRAGRFPHAGEIVQALRK
jgi:selT/selW/selH-like putative selenoprotein